MRFHWVVKFSVLLGLVALMIVAISTPSWLKFYFKNADQMIEVGLWKQCLYRNGTLKRCFLFKEEFKPCKTIVCARPLRNKPGWFELGSHSQRERFIRTSQIIASTQAIAILSIVSLVCSIGILALHQVKNSSAPTDLESQSRSVHSTSCVKSVTPRDETLHTISKILVVLGTILFVMTVIMNVAIKDDLITFFANYERIEVTVHPARGYALKEFTMRTKVGYSLTIALVVIPLLLVTVVRVFKQGGYEGEVEAPQMSIRTNNQEQHVHESVTQYLDAPEILREQYPGEFALREPLQEGSRSEATDAFNLPPAQPYTGYSDFPQQYLNALDAADRQF